MTDIKMSNINCENDERINGAYIVIIQCVFLF